MKIYKMFGCYHCGRKRGQEHLPSCTSPEYMKIKPTLPVNESWGLRVKISEIFIRWGVSTKQIVISQIVELFEKHLSTARQEAKAQRTEEIQDELFDLIQTHDCDKGKECVFVDRLIKIIDSLTSKGGEDA